MATAWPIRPASLPGLGTPMPTALLDPIAADVVMLARQARK
jgi:hypothetical protein